MYASVSLVYQRQDISDGRRPVREIAASLAVQPDSVWVRGEPRTPKVTITHKRDGFCFDFRPTGPVKWHGDYYDTDWVGHEVTNLLRRLVPTHGQIAAALGDHEVVVSVVAYTYGQVNPGFGLSPEAVRLLASIGGRYDLDLYAVDED